MKRKKMKNENKHEMKKINVEEEQAIRKEAN